MREWTLVYTWRMPPACRETRRAEIESDLWTFQFDAAGKSALGSAVHLFLRLLIGIPDDLGWRMEQAATTGTLTQGSIALSARVAGAVLFICALWVIDADADRGRAGVDTYRPIAGAQRQIQPDGRFVATALLNRQQPTRSADEVAVREVIAKYMAARATRDARAIEALFTADADQQTTSGEWRRGRAAIVAGTLQSSERNPGARAIRIESIRFLTADVAIVDGPYAITAAGGAAPRRMWTSLVVMRASDGWRIAAIRNTVPTSAAQ